MRRRVKLLALSLLIGEYALLAPRVNVSQLGGLPGFAGLAGKLTYLQGLAVVVLAVLALLLRNERAEVAINARAWSARASVLIFAQLAAFAALWASGPVVFDTSAVDARLVWAWLLGYGASVSLLLWPFVPASGLFSLLRRHTKTIAVASVIGLILWQASVLVTELWTEFSTLTLYASAELLSWLGPVSMIAEQRLLGMGDFAVTIEPGCSGYEGMALLTALMALFLWLRRSTLRFPRALVVLPLAAFAAFLSNIVRIAALVLVGARFSPELALGGFHSQLGWLLFCGLAIVGSELTVRSRFLQKEERAEPEEQAVRVAEPSPATPLLLPLIVWLASGMLAGLLASGGLDFWYGLRVILLSGVLLGLWRALPLSFALSGQSALVAVGLGTAVFVFWVLSASAPEQLPQSPRALLGPWFGPWLVARALGSALVVPLVEELAFRAYLLRRLIDRDFERVSFAAMRFGALAVSSLAFGALHPRWAAASLAGVAYAYAQQRSASVSGAVIAHAVTNGLLLAYATLFEAWWVLG